MLNLDPLRVLSGELPLAPKQLVLGSAATVALRGLSTWSHNMDLDRAMRQSLPKQLPIQSLG